MGSQVAVKSFIMLCCAAALPLLGTTAAFAEMGPDGRWDSKAYKRKIFGGWDGISAHCALSPEDENNKALCDWAIQKARVIAATTRILLVPGSSNHERRVVQLYRDYKGKSFLRLEISIQSAGTSPKAMSFLLTASASYSNAVEAKGEKYEGKPRSGSLVVWDKALLAVGTAGPDFDWQVRQAAETNLNAFFADFMEGNQQP